MKKIILTVCLLGFFTAIHAQAFKIQENRASFGAGLGWSRDYGYVYSATSYPSLNALIERSIMRLDNLGLIAVGAQVGFQYNSYSIKSPIMDESGSWTNFYFVPRLALYIQELLYESDFPKNIDLYGGVGVGLNLSSHKSSIAPSDNNFDLGYTVFVGGRYYFAPSTALFAEFGYGMSYVNVGFTIKY